MTSLPAASSAQAADPPATPVAPVTRRALTWSVLRRHWLATVLLVAGLALRVLAQLAYRPALFYIDSVKYLYNAQGNDPEGYKGPLRAILLAGNLDTVAAVQHLLGLALAVVLYILLLHLGVSRWLAALAIAPVLLDGYQLQLEQTIMPTVWFEALVVAGIAILLWRPDPGWRRAAVGGLVLGTTAIVAQVGEALIVPAVIFLLVAGGGWRRAIVRSAALFVAFAVPILAYCTGSYLATGSFEVSHQGVTSLYGRMAAAVDCKTIRLPAADRSVCPTVSEQAKGNDWLAYNPASPVQAIYRTRPRIEVNRIITTFDSAVLHQQPLSVLKAYSRDVLKLYAIDRQTAPGDPPITRWQFAKSYPYFSPHATRPEIRAITSQFGGGAPAVWRPVADFLHHYQLDGGYTPGPLLALFSITGLAGSVIALVRRRLDPQTRRLALGCLLCFGSAAFLLLVSDLFVFSWRYQAQALVALAPAGVLGIAIVARLVRPSARAIRKNSS
jgi:hypothetical protein